MGSSSPTMRALCRRAPGVQRGALGLLLAASLGVGCGGDDGETGSTTTTTTTEAPCGPGELELADGRCQPPGLPLDMPCPPGEAPLEDGSCQAAGVPPSECGDGFTSDGEGGCEPILPKDPCPDGLMAIPGLVGLVHPSLARAAVGDDRPDPGSAQEEAQEDEHDPDDRDQPGVAGLPA